MKPLYFNRLLFSKEQGEEGVVTMESRWCKQGLLADDGLLRVNSWHFQSQLVEIDVHLCMCI